MGDADLQIAAAGDAGGVPLGPGRPARVLVSQDEQEGEVDRRRTAGEGGPRGPASAGLKSGRRTTAVFKVRRTGVTGVIDDKPVMEHKTDYSDFTSLAVTGWDVGKGCFGLGLTRKTLIHKIELVEISGTGRVPPAGK